MDEPLPTVASFGLSWSPFRPLVISADLSQPLNLLDLAKSEYPALAAGFSLAFTDAFGLQGGLLLKGGNPRISIGSTFILDLVKITVNYTLDLTTKFTPLNRISINASFILGDLGRSALAKKVDKLYLDGLAEYGRGNLDAAIVFWNQALADDQTFDPARESLVAAENSKKLKADMEAIGKMDLTGQGQQTDGQAAPTEPATTDQGAPGASPQTAAPASQTAPVAPVSPTTQATPAAPASPTTQTTPAVPPTPPTTPAPAPSTTPAPAPNP
jgi:hypothetical protein